MNVKPLRTYRKPNYPTRLDVLGDSDLLVRHVPSTWKKTAQMASVAALFLDVYGCATSEKQAVVAPIFEHGGGRGSIGCVMVSPPVFLSEEEALQVIQEEFKQAGIEFSQRNYEFENVLIPANYNGFASNELKSLRVDLFNQKKTLAVEFVSKDDCFDLVKNRKVFSTVTGYCMKDVTAYIGKQIEMSENGVYFGTLYDPFSYVDEKEIKNVTNDLEELADRWREMEKVDKDKAKVLQKEMIERYQKKIDALKKVKTIESKRLLRLQVADFVEWLKGQGVI